MTFPVMCQDFNLLGYSEFMTFPSLLSMSCADDEVAVILIIDEFFSDISLAACTWSSFPSAQRF